MHGRSFVVLPLLYSVTLSIQSLVEGEDDEAASETRIPLAWVALDGLAAGRILPCTPGLHHALLTSSAQPPPAQGSSAHLGKDFHKNPQFKAGIFTLVAMDGTSNSVAVTASKLAHHQHRIQNADTQDSVAHGASIDFASTADNPKVEKYHTYILSQSSYNAQTLIPIGEDSTVSSYNIKHHTISRFPKRRKHQPHILITKKENEGDEDTSTTIAEIWHDTQSHSSKIIYPSNPTNQPKTHHLAPSPHKQRHFTTPIGSSPYIWRPLGPSINVLELVNEQGRKAALFVYAEVVAQRSVSLSGTSMDVRAREVGRLHVADWAFGEEGRREEVCVGAVGVVGVVEGMRGAAG